MTDALAAEETQLSHREILTVMSGLMLGMLVAALSQTVVETALHTIVGERGGRDELDWVVSGKLLDSTAYNSLLCQPTDFYGQRTAFQCSNVVLRVWISLARTAQQQRQTG